MLRKHLSLWLLSSLLLCPAPLRADKEERKHFLSHGPGARAGALGEAFTALADDATAIYYNPAGLSFQRGAVTADHTPILGGGRYNFIGFHYPSKLGSFGLGVIQFAIDGIERRQTIGDAAEETGATQTAWFLPYSKGWKDISVGFSLKKIDMDLASFSGSGLGLDGGLLYSTYLNNVFFFTGPNARVGFTVKNLIEPSLTLRSEKERFPREMKVGLAFSGRVFSQYNQSTNRMIFDVFTLSLDFWKVPGGSVEPGLGVEYALRDLVSLRAGFRDNVSFGLGYGRKDSSFSLDYSLFATALDPQHRFSFSYYFTEPRAEPFISPQFRQYRRSQKDSSRHRDRYLVKGKTYLRDQKYQRAIQSLEKALILDPMNPSVRTLWERAKDGRRLKIVRGLIEDLKNQPKANFQEVSHLAIQITRQLPENQEVKQTLASVKKAMADLGPTPLTYFNFTRNQEMTRIHAAYHTELASGAASATRFLLSQAQTRYPESPLTEHMVADFKTQEKELFNQRMNAANRALVEKDYLTANKHYLKAKEIFPERLGLKIQLRNFHATYRRLKDFKTYDDLYQEQVYHLAALAFVEGRKNQAARYLNDLLFRNAIHDEGHFLLGYFDQELTTKENSNEKISDSSRPDDGVVRLAVH